MKFTKSIAAVLFSAGLYSVQACGQGVPQAAAKLKVVQITDQLTHPTAFADPNDGSGRMFVCEQEGKIKWLNNGKLQSPLFLDITKDVVKKPGYEERGLLGLAFHPKFSQNGKFYVHYSAPTSGANHKSVIKEFQVSKTNPNQADVNSGRVVIEFDQPQSNHNGGDVKFGKDGFLYISVGDGGGQRDQHGKYGNAQNPDTFLGKILRIDIDQNPYGIPKDNPFVGKAGAKPEIFAYGFRNPWRISFDRKTGKLFAGDVGQDAIEEVDIVENGGNYGWRVMEGSQPHNTSDPKPAQTINPISEYPHAEGISITGGFVYRGTQVPSLDGKYIFADWTGPVWQLTEGKNGKWDREKLNISQDAGYWHIYSFGEDSKGEIYLLTVVLDGEKGVLYKIAQ